MVISTRTMFSLIPIAQYQQLTSDGAVDDGTIFQLDRDRLVVELHQKPVLVSSTSSSGPHLQLIFHLHPQARPDKGRRKT